LSEEFCSNYYNCWVQCIVLFLTVIYFENLYLNMTLFMHCLYPMSSYVIRKVAVGRLLALEF
jgi:hypothetical protein